MSALKIVAVHDDGTVIPISSVPPSAKPGSMVDVSTGHREVIMFVNHGDHSEISRSVFGADVEEPNAASSSGSDRMIHTTGAEPIRHLRAGEAHDMRVQTERMQQPITVRFTHIGDTA